MKYLTYYDKMTNHIYAYKESENTNNNSNDVFFRRFYLENDRIAKGSFLFMKSIDNDSIVTFVMINDKISDKKISLLNSLTGQIEDIALFSFYRNSISYFQFANYELLNIE